MNVAEWRDEQANARPGGYHDFTASLPHFGFEVDCRAWFYVEDGRAKVETVDVWHLSEHDWHVLPWHLGGFAEDYHNLLIEQAMKHSDAMFEQARDNR